MALKRQAIPLPDLAEKRVLDVGTDHGYWAFLAAEMGAWKVVGLDRNRVVRGKGFANLIAQNTAIARTLPRGGACEFHKVDLGCQWREFGRYDAVLVFSVYHHIFENCGDHLPIWFWLWRHCTHDAVVLWEGPVDDTDPVVRANVSDANRKTYTKADILAAASVYFEPEYVGPALHEPTREVWRFRPLPLVSRTIHATMLTGAGGATAAFEYNDGWRIGEIEEAIGLRAFPGSLNLKCDAPFDWGVNYYRAQIMDVVERSRGLRSEWAPRWARFYPLTIDGKDAWGFRFEGDGYDARFLELIADKRLRDLVAGPRVTVTR